MIQCVSLTTAVYSRALRPVRTESWESRSSSPDTFIEKPPPNSQGRSSYAGKGQGRQAWTCRWHKYIHILSVHNFIILPQEINLATLDTECCLKAWSCQGHRQRLLHTTGPEARTMTAAPASLDNRLWAGSFTHRSSGLTMRPQTTSVGIGKLDTKEWGVCQERVSRASLQRESGKSWPRVLLCLSRLHSGRDYCGCWESKLGPSGRAGSALNHQDIISPAFLLDS